MSAVLAPPRVDGRAAPAARTFHTLDALRGIAAATVVLVHAGFFYSTPIPPAGFLAVDLFFVMSGFIVSHRYDADFAAGMGVRAFAAIRLARLYPLFALGTLLGVLPSVLALLHDHSAFHLARVATLPQALLMLPAHMPDAMGVHVLYPLNLVSWSLALEIVVNLLYAALVSRLTVPRLAALVALGFVGLCACAIGWDTLQVGFEWPRAAGGLARILFGFCAGVLIRRLLARGWVLPSIPWPAPLLAALALFCTPPFLGGVAWELAGCVLVVPLIVAAAAGREPPPALHRACAAAGVYSYALYSLHVPLVGLMLRAQTRLHIDPAHQTLGTALAFTAVLVAVVVAAHHGYDQPIRRRLSRLRAAPSRHADPAGRRMLSPSR